MSLKEKTQTLQQLDNLPDPLSLGPAFKNLITEQSLVPVNVQVMPGYTDEETALDREELLIALQCEV